MKAFEEFKRKFKPYTKRLDAPWPYNEELVCEPSIETTWQAALKWALPLLPDPKKLELLANWIDLKYPEDRNPEVQSDLREWAKIITTIKKELSDD